MADYYDPLYMEGVVDALTVVINKVSKVTTDVHQKDPVKYAREIQQILQGEIDRATERVLNYKKERYGMEFSESPRPPVDYVKDAPYVAPVDSGDQILLVQFIGSTKKSIRNLVGSRGDIQAMTITKFLIAWLPVMYKVIPKVIDYETIHDMVMYMVQVQLERDNDPLLEDVLDALVLCSWQQDESKFKALVDEMVKSQDSHDMVTVNPIIRSWEFNTLVYNVLWGEITNVTMFLNMPNPFEALKDSLAQTRGIN